jgi:septal ring-binding cell division protein DamX
LVRSLIKVQAKANSQVKVKVEVEAEAVAEAGSINTGSHIHGILQKDREKVQKANAKEKAIVQTIKAVQRAQASTIPKVAVNLQSLAIRVAKEVTLQINAIAIKVNNLGFSKFSKIRCIINRCLLHLSFQVLVLQQCISFRQD